jgi:hypothetical protein
MARVRSAAGVCAALVLFAACGGGSHSSSTVRPTTTLPSSVMPVNKTVNYAGFSVDLQLAELHGAVLRLSTEATNNLPSPQLFNPTFVVTSAGRTYEGIPAQTPTVSPAGTVAVELDVNVDVTFLASDAVVVFGNTGKNQAMIPLGAGGTFIPLLDVSLPLPAPVTAGEQVFSFLKARLSAYTYDGSQLDAGTEELTLTMTVTNSDPQNSYDIDGSDFKFVNGAETLNSSNVKDVSVNPGGAATTQTYADIDNFRAGAAITMTIIGADRQQNNVSRTLTITAPPVR